MITIPKEQFAVIKKSVSLSQHEEACGLFLGHGSLPNSIAVSTAVPCMNIVEKERHRRSEIDPVVRLRLERSTRNLSTGIVGHYHSHPGGNAVPSKFDLESAHEPTLFWLILGSLDGNIVDIGAWGLDKDQKTFKSLKLSILS